MKRKQNSTPSEEVKRIKQTQEEDEAETIILDDKPSYLNTLLQSSLGQRMVYRDLFKFKSKDICYKEFYRRMKEIKYSSGRLYLLPRNSGEIHVLDATHGEVVEVIDTGNVVSNSFCLQNGAVIYCDEKAMYKVENSVVKWQLNRKFSFRCNILYHSALKEVFVAEKSKIIRINPDIGQVLDSTLEFQDYELGHIFIKLNENMLLVVGNNKAKTSRYLFIFPDDSLIEPRVIQLAPSGKQFTDIFQLEVINNFCVVLDNEATNFYDMATEDLVFKMCSEVLCFDKCLDTIFTSTRGFITALQMERVKELIPHPLERSVCRELERLGAKLPKSFYTDVYDKSSPFCDALSYLLEVDMDKKTKFKLDPSLHPSLRKLEPIQFDMEVCDQDVILLSEYVTLSRDLKVEFEYLDISLSFLDFLSGLKPCEHVLLPEHDECAICFKEIVELVANPITKTIPQNEISECYERLCKGLVDIPDVSGLTSESVFRILNTLKDKTVNVKGMEYGKSDLVVVYCCKYLSHHTPCIYYNPYYDSDC